LIGLQQVERVEGWTAKVTPSDVIRIDVLHWQNSLIHLEEILATIQRISFSQVLIKEMLDVVRVLIYHKG
jgi:hypothetical protein